MKKIVLSIRPDLIPQFPNILNILSLDGMDIETFYEYGVITGYVYENKIEKIKSYTFITGIEIETNTAKFNPVVPARISSANSN